MIHGLERTEQEMDCLHENLIQTSRIEYTDYLGQFFSVGAIYYIMICSNCRKTFRKEKGGEIK